MIAHRNKTRTNARTADKETPKMITPIRCLLAAVGTLGLIVLGAIAPAPALGAGSSPAWSILSTSKPTNFAPGSGGRYAIAIANGGSGPTDGSAVTVTDTLPAGLTASPQFGCTVSGQTISCPVEDELHTGVFEPGETIEGLGIDVAVEPSAHEGIVINTVSVSGGGAPPVTITEPTTISSAALPFGLASFNSPAINPDGTPDTQAGGHPYALTTTFAFNTSPKTEDTTDPFGGRQLIGNFKDVQVDPPLGLIGNPQALPECTQDQFREQICPPSSQIGVSRTDFSESPGVQFHPVYNLVPPPGVPAQFAIAYDFGSVTARVRLNAQVRSGSDYGLTVSTSGLPQTVGVVVSSVTLWGVPADPSHNDQRCQGIYTNTSVCNEPGNSAPGTHNGPNPFTAPPKPFLTMPTACPGTPLQTSVETDSWQEPGNFASKDATLPAMEECESLDFSPTLKARPSTDTADSPSGLSVDVHLPVHEGCEEEAGGEVVCENAEAELKDAKVTLPEGLVVNPAGANGLEGCSAAEIGYKPGTSGPAEFTPGPAECPDASRIGSVKVRTQLLDHPLPGSVYLAKPYDNPFNSILAIYIAIYDPASGVVVKLPGHVETDPQTGRLTTTFEENPQLPFEDFELEFFKGATAPLMTPPTCGAYATGSSMSSWAGQSATPGDHYLIDRSPSGGTNCPSNATDLPNSPSFSAGTVTPIAAAYSPFVLNLRREDGSQRLSTIETTLPPGLVGKLAGVPYCPQAAIDAAAQKSGREEQASPSCPSASKLGTVVVGAGAGPAPYYVRGKAYLAGPYEGAPLSIVVLTPAVAGPFDLGTVVTRVALHVNPETAQITAKSDPLPSVWKAGGQGFPLDIRSIAMKIDRPEFTLNPTSCDPLSLSGSSLSTLGQAAALTDRFQVAECGRLAFKPRLSLSLKGKTTRGGHPSLRAQLTMPPGGANVAKAVVALPHSEFLDQGHLNNICTRVQFAEGNGNGEKCPTASIYGHAKAWSPLLEAPLEGPVYLRSSSHKLPDLVAALNGQIAIALDGRIDSVNGGIRNSFEVVPDAPVSKFVLEMPGGRKGLLENSENICQGTHRASADFTAQNGRISDTEPAVKAKCRSARHRRHRH